MLTSETAKMTYTVTDVSIPYAIGFVYNWNPNSTPQIKVYKNKLSNTPLAYGTNYTISDDGLSIVLITGVAVGDRLDIIRDIPMVQLSDYTVGRIDPDQIESDMDTTVMRDQQLKGDMQFIAEVPEDHENRIQECESDIDDIESLIPNQATDTNQLADKDFVNSSIATSTATFRGTYDTLAELEAVTADDNDYGFVVSTDAAGNTLYSRYKYANGSWAFEYTLNNSSFTADQWAAINSGITSAIVQSLNATTGKNVGEIFFTLRNDSELRGAVECDGDTYSTTDFTGADSIGAKLEAGKVPYVSLSQYATLLAANGSVGVFGWDGTGTTPFRVPSLNDIFIESGAVAELGDYEAAGVPNITGDFAANNGGSASAHGAVKVKATVSGHGWDGTATTLTTYEVDASESSAVYGNSTTVQPSAIRMRVMVQLAVAATDTALETCTGVTADVASLKSHEVVAFQIPSADNNYTGYKLYANKIVEIWGYASTNDNAVTLPLTMADTNYWAMAIPQSNSNTSFAAKAFYVDTKTTTTVQFGATSDPIYWEVKGVAA